MLKSLLARTQSFAPPRATMSARRLDGRASSRRLGIPASGEMGDVVALILSMR
jgi:hypothetical protein